MSEIHGAFGTAMSEIHGGLYQRLLGSREIFSVQTVEAKMLENCVVRSCIYGMGRIEKKNLQKQESTSEIAAKHQLCTTIMIQELKGLKMGTIFHGQILVIYKTLVDQVHGIQLLPANLVDSRGNMTITLNVPHNLIAATEVKLVVGQGICITDFKVSPRTVYDHGDHGDCPCILVLHEKSILEAIPPICTEYRFVPTTTINQITSNQLTSTTAAFATGIVAGLVTTAKEIAGQYVLTIKDGPSQKDKATVHLFSTFRPIFKSIQQQISNQEAPMMLFRNLARGKERGSLRTCKSTFITAVTSNRVLADLSKLPASTTKVKGMLTIADIHAEQTYMQNPLLQSATIALFRSIHLEQFSWINLIVPHADS